MFLKLFIRDRDFYRGTAVIMIPVVLQMLINIGVNLMDTVMLGSFGEVQISGSSLGNQFYSIFHIFCLGLGGGAAVLTAQYWGRGDLSHIKRITTLMLRIGAAASLLFTAAMALFPRGIMSLYATDPLVIEAGARYFRFLAWACFFHGLSLTAIIVLRTVGVVRLGLLASTCSFGLNIFFNWVFIFGKLGAPRMEIGGAAVGTLLARVCEFAIVMGYLFFKDQRIRYRPRDLLLPVSHSLPPFLKVGTPVIVSDILLALGNNAVAAILGRMGREMTAANAITTVVVQLSTVFIMGMSSASGVVVGNTVGRGDRDRAMREGITFLSLSAVVGVLAGVLIWAAGPLALRFYNIDGNTREITLRLMEAVAFIVVFQTVSSVMTKGVLRGGGDTRFLMVADVFFLWVASVPLGYLSGLVLGWPAAAVYVCLKIDMVLKSVWCVWRLMSRKWMRAV